MKVKSLFLFLTVLFITGSFMVNAQTSSSVLPDFTFFKLDDKPFLRKEVNPATKSVFVYFDPACEHCQVEIGSLGKKYAEFKNVSFYLVSANEKAKIGRFMDTYGKLLKGKKNVNVLYDRDMQYIIKFSPTQYPDVNVYSAQGKLIKHFSGITNVEDILKAVNQI